MHDRMFKHIITFFVQSQVEIHLAPCGEGGKMITNSDGMDKK